MPSDFADRVDEMADIISRDDGTPATYTGEPFPVSTDVAYTNIPQYRPGTRELLIPSSYYPRTSWAGAAENDEEKARMTRARDYVNPLVLGHEAAHAYGVDDEAQADAFAAMTNFDGYDLADFYNRITDGGEPRGAIPGDDHLSDNQRLQMLAGMLYGGGNPESTVPAAEPSPAPTSSPETSDTLALADEGGRVPYRNAPAATSPEYQPVDYRGKYPGIEEAGDGAPSFYDRLSGLASSISDSAQRVYNYLPDAYSLANSITEGISELADMPRRYIFQPEPSTASDSIQAIRNPPPARIGDATFGEQRAPMTQNRAPTPTEQVMQGTSATKPQAAAAPAQATQAEAPTSQEQVGPPAPNMFSAVRGGYGNQLRALRNQAGLTQDQRDFLEQANYRQLAGAMNNRGLRVGDRFDANSLIQRMRQMRASQDQPGAMAGAAMPSIDIQNQRGRNVNRGSLASMRSSMGNQARANVNPTGGLRGAGAQRPVPTPAQKTPPTQNTPAMPNKVGPDNIDDIMGAPPSLRGGR